MQRSSLHQVDRVKFLCSSIGYLCTIRDLAGDDAVHKVAEQVNLIRIDVGYEEGLRWRDAVKMIIEHVRGRLGDTIKLADLYAYVPVLVANRFIKTHATPEATLRRVLQELRDEGYLRFRGDGEYEVTSHRLL